MLDRKNTLLSRAKQGLEKMICLENLISLSIAGLPLYLVKLDFFGIPTNILEALEVAVVFWWYFEKKQKQLEAREMLKKYGKYLAATGLVFLGLTSSLIVSGNYKVGLGIVKSWFLLPALFAFVAINVIDNKEKIRNILLAFYFSAGIASLIALVYYFFGRLTYDGRLEAFFNSPNYLAMYLSPAVIIGAILVRSKNSEFKIKNQDLGLKIFYYANLVMLLASLYLTRSYAAWGAVAASLLIAEAATKGKNIFKSSFFWSSMILVIMLFSAQWNSGKLRDAYTLSERSSLTSRLMIWKAAKKIAGDNLVWGIGPGNFQSKYLEYQKYFPPYLEWAVPHPHNIFFTFFLYSGLTGVVGLVLLLLFWFQEVLKKEPTELKTIFLAVMIYILLHGLVDTTYFKNDLAVLFWLNFLALNLKKGPRRPF